jgi:hypothetical protein
LLLPATAQVGAGRLALICVVLATPLSAQSTAPPATIGPWLGASFSLGVVGIEPRSSAGGPGAELTAGLKIGPSWRIGGRLHAWSSMAFDGPSWKARTVTGVVAYRTQSTFTFTGGFGAASIWDAAGPTSVRAGVVETGVEFTARVIRFYALRDWAVSTSHVKGRSLPFGSLYQFHVGLGLLLD